MPSKSIAIGLPLAFLMVLSPMAFGQTPSATESVIDAKDLQSCGLITRFPGDITNPNCLQQETNMISDRTGVMTRRLGYSPYNATACPGSQPIRGMWNFYSDSGINYIIMFSSNSMFYSPGDGTCNYITGLQGTFSGTATMECVQSGAAGGNVIGAGLWCTDGVDGVFVTNVTSTQAVTQAPTGYHIGTFRNRILISGVPGTGSGGSGSQVYGSGELNGLDYTIPAIQLTTSPFIISINGINDGQIVTCLMGEYQNQYLIGRNYDLWGLSGYNLSDFTLRNISLQVGCLEPRSVQEVTNVKYWLSHRGIEGYTGTQINRVSYPIDANILPIITSAGNLVTNSLATQAQWQSGNLVASGVGAPLSATISINSVVPSSFSLINVSTTDFSVGTTSGTAIMAPGLVGPSGTATQFGVMYEARNNILPENTSIPWTDSSNGGGNTFVSVTGGILTLSAGSPAFAGGVPNRYASEMLPLTIGTTVNNLIVFNTGASINLLGQAQIGFYNTANGTGILNTGGFTGVQISTAGANYGATGVEDGTPLVGYSTFTIIVTSYTPGSTSGIARFWVNGNYEGTSVVSQPINALLMYITNGPNSSFNTSTLSMQNFYYANNVADPGPVNLGVGISTYTSNIFNLGMSTPIVGSFNVSVSTPPGTTAAFAVRSSTSPNNDKWTAYESVLPGYTPKTLVRQYVQYQSTFTEVNLATGPVFGAVSLIAEDTGYYITPCVAVDSPTSYGNFLVNAITNGGSFTFWLSTGATCANATNPGTTWNSQTPNSVISVTTVTTFLAARVLFNVDAATEVPTLNSLIFSWNQGSSRPPTCSVQWDDRYLLFYTSSTLPGAVNDHAIVYDQNQKWNTWDDEYGDSGIVYNNTLYTGDANATGTVYIQDIGQTDNGKPFTMTFQTADFDGGDPMMNKEFSRAYIVLGAPNNNNSSASLSCNYSLDGSTSTFSLGSVILSESPESTGYFVAKLPFNASLPTVGHWINLTCSFTGSVGPISIHRVKLVYVPRSWD